MVFDVLEVEMVRTSTEAMLVRVHGTWRASAPTVLAMPELLVCGPSGTVSCAALAGPAQPPPRPAPEGVRWVAGFGVRAAALEKAELTLAVAVEEEQRRFPVISGVAADAGGLGAGTAVDLLVADLARVGHAPDEIVEGVEGALGLRVGQDTLDAAFRGNAAG